MIWKPDVSIYNKQDLSNGILAADPKSANTNAQLFENGNIVWTVPVSHKEWKYLLFVTFLWLNAMIQRQG